MSWGDVGRYMRRARALRRQTQAEFAREVGLSVRTVGALEAGEHRSYDETTVVRVESALGWAPGSLDRVANGGRPIVERDPMLARIVDAWPRLPTEIKRMLSQLVAFAMRVDGEAFDESVAAEYPDGPDTRDR